MRKAFGLQLTFIFGMSVLLILLELLLRQLPVASARDTRTPTALRPATTYVPNDHFTYSIDWDLYEARQVAINEYGFHGNCRIEKKLEAGVFILGDSYTDAMMLNASDSVGGQLQKRLPDRNICAIGFPGAGASEYLAQVDTLLNIGLARTWVFVINRTDFVESYGQADGLAKFLDVSSTQNMDYAYFPRAVPGRSEELLRSFARSSALYRYIKLNINIKRVWQSFICSITKSTCGSGQNLTQESRKLEVQAIGRFLDGVRSRADDGQARAILAFNDTENGKVSVSSADRIFWNDLSAEAEIRRIDVIFLSDSLVDDACGEKGCRLFRDGHWSAAGHAQVAKAIAAQMR